MSDEVKRGVIKAISDTFEVPENMISDRTSYGDFEEWDSIGHLRLMMELESVFSVRFSTDEINKERGVESLCELIESLIPDA